jgi:hypothetical protein
MLMFLMTNSCIEPYMLQIGEEDLNKYVVSGQVTNQEGYQFVTVAIGSPVDNPGFIALHDCDVVIHDDLGNDYAMEEYKIGRYRVWMDQENLTPGTAYKVSITTPAGIEIESDFDRMPSCPEVDSVYYEREDLPTSNPEVPRKGVQFYIDLNGNSDDSRYYRWEMIETWEYHAKHAKTYYFSGTTERILPPDSSTFFCWKTLKIDDIYTLSTENLVDNLYTRLPLHFVDNYSSRLEHVYSLLVKQYAISAEAYDYWDKLQTNASSEGGLYEQQPLHVTGNLHSKSNSNYEVLGFFSATSVASKRIFAENIDLECEYQGCLEAKMISFDWEYIYSHPEIWPVYIYYKRIYEGPPVNAWVTATYWLDGLCIDCTADGGTTDKPSFWP